MEGEIRKIQRDITLTNDEKTKKIQNLFSSQHDTPMNLSNHNETCNHYEKSCSQFEFDCCSTIDPCKRCHVERDSCKSSHVKSIVCLKCKKRQKPSATCCECNEQFSTFHCEICELWTVKEIFHCNFCGICRVGKKETTFHCHSCKMCFHDTEENHKCPEFSFHDSVCVICNECVFNHQQSSFPFSCGHFIHNSCFHKFIEYGHSTCPYCKKSFCDRQEEWSIRRDLIQRNPIPKDFFVLKEFDIVPTKYGKFKILQVQNEMYFGHFIEWILKNKKPATGLLNKNSIDNNIYVSILCNDCSSHSSVLFHFYGLECKVCGSFNTQQ